MANINPNNYRVPGIYFEEVNNSQTDNIPAQEDIINFVVGFSRKSKVYNKPILIRTSKERETVFGTIDRSLEKKGSFFDRTIDNCLKTAPVYAMALLNVTDDDKLNYISMSLNPKTINSVIKVEKYDRFFDKTNFWERNTDNFLTLANSNTNLLHFTNMGDKKISVFAFKSSITGFDITAENWYGSKESVPSYIYPNDLISDYMLRVVVVSGDFSNYKVLSNDSKWSTYFNASGLRKEQLSNFINDKNVVVLGDYETSLIPNFRDKDNNNLFIENIVNRFTDITGLYCAFNIDKFESDFPNGLVDLVGHTLVDSETTSINYLSYKDTIVDTELFNNSVLDRLKNVGGVGTIASVRTTAKTEGTLSGLVITNLNATLVGQNPSAVFTASSGYAIINGAEVPLTTTTINFTSVTASVTNGLSNYRIDTIYIDNTGAFNIISGSVVEFTSGSTTISAIGCVGSTEYPNDAIVLGYVLRESTQAGTFVSTYFPVSLNTGGFKPLTVGTQNTNDLILNSTTGNYNIKLTFNGTASVLKSNYDGYRRKRYFDYIIANKNSTKSVIIDNAGAKKYISECTWIDNSSTTSADNYIQIISSDTAVDFKTPANVSTNGKFIMYFIDDEFIVGLNGGSTKLTPTTSNDGVISKFSKFYTNYYDGLIKSGDFIYEKMSTTAVRFLSHTDGYDYIIIPTASISSGLSGVANASKLFITDSVSNNGLLNVTANGVTTLLNDSNVNILSSETAFRVSQNVVTESSVTVSIYDYDKKHYLKIYTIGSVVNLVFVDSINMITAYPLTTLTNNTNLAVYSEESSYAQTVEVEMPTGYVLTDNKILIDATRYPEIVVGDYLKAYIDVNLLGLNEIPKKLTRIISKKAWSGNTNSINYAELVTDSKIDLQIFGGDYQTTRYTNIGNYVDTLKTVVLEPFKVREASYPDGTETKQTSILNVLAKGTSLFDAVTNKNVFSWRYLVDSFGLGLTELSKQVLMDICGERKSSFAIINAPSLKSFTKSTNPSFTNLDGSLNFDYILSGGNINGNPTFLYSLGTGNGKSCAGYFAPYFTVNDNGRPLSMPPASFICNTYMNKLNSNVGNKYAWTISAGIEDGIIDGIAGVEKDFNDKQIDKLIQLGINHIIYRNGKFYINTEFTADITPISSLSYIHARETLIELENELFNMLLKYQNKFNTTTIRSQIKRKADDICQRYVDRNAIYTFNNIIDETNNTNTIIDNAMGLLETSISIAKGMSKLVNIININNNNTLNSTGFNS